MNKDQYIEEYIRISVNIHNSLEKLKELDAEREQIKTLIMEGNTSKETILSMMAESLKKYETELEYMKEQKVKATALKEKVRVFKNK